MAEQQRPTDAERADAVLRLMDEFDAAHAALNAAMRVLGEGRERGAGRASGPLFPFVGEKVVQRISEARQALWTAREHVAPQFLDSTRAVSDQSRTPAEPLASGDLEARDE